MLALLALAAQPTPAPSPDLFSTAIHRHITEETLRFHAGEGLHVSPDAEWLLGRAQFRSDVTSAFDEWLGDKDASRYYLHHVWPNHDYTPTAHAAVLAELGRGGTHATLDDFVSLSRLRVFRETGRLLVARKGALTNAEVGQVLYALGVLFHETQDRKHNEGNGSRPNGAEILQFEHFIPYLGQGLTDVAPGPAMVARATLRSDELVGAYMDALAREAGDYDDTLYASFRAFTRARGANGGAYRPNTRLEGVDFTMDHLFPRWPVLHDGPPPALWSPAPTGE